MRDIIDIIHARVTAFSFLVGAGGRHVELRLRHRDRLALTLDRKAVLRVIADDEVRTNAGDNLAYRADGGGGRIKHSPVNSSFGP
jgi:hypothetical protein